MEQCEGAVDVEVCECNFSIRLFLCQHPLASPALDRPAGLVVSPFPSPTARHSRSQAALRGRTEGNLKGIHKEGKKESRKEGLKKEFRCDCAVLCVDV